MWETGVDGLDGDSVPVGIGEDFVGFEEEDAVGLDAEGGDVAASHEGEGA